MIGQMNGLQTDACPTDRTQDDHIHSHIEGEVQPVKLEQEQEQASQPPRAPGQMFAVTTGASLSQGSRSDEALTKIFCTFTGLQLKKSKMIAKELRLYIETYTWGVTPFHSDL